MTNQEYNGWKNYQTWNVALWIGNDEGLYRMARRYRYGLHPYHDFVKELQDLGGDIAQKTPDGVRWDDSRLDIEALDEMIEEL